MRVLGTVLLGVGVLLPLAAVLLRRRRVPFVVAAAAANIAWLSIYAFGEDDYTSDGRSRWQTHNSTGSHAFYVVALVLWLLLALVAALLRGRERALELPTLLMSGATLVLWFAAHLAFDNN